MAESPWLLLIHQIPPVPAYLRVKVGRRLQAVGAVALKNSVYVLPRSDQSLEDLQWVRREIVAGGGEATLCGAEFLEGHTDAEVQQLFLRARQADYAALLVEARALQSALGKARQRALSPSQARVAVIRLRKQLAAVAAIDPFGAPGREPLEAVLNAVEGQLRPARAGARPAPQPGAGWQKRTWVTRRGVQVDRIASAWLIARFIDRKARFKFVAGHDYRPAAGDVRFDMFEGEFTHEGDLCTFEVLLRRFGLDEPALCALGEIVHDIDLKDDKFGRPEAMGVSLLVSGIASRDRDDLARIALGGEALDALHESLRRKR